MSYQDPQTLFKWKSLDESLYLHYLPKFSYGKSVLIVTICDTLKPLAFRVRSHYLSLHSCTSCTANALTFDQLARKMLASFSFQRTSDHREGLRDKIAVTHGSINSQYLPVDKHAVHFPIIFICAFCRVAGKCVHNGVTHATEEINASKGCPSVREQNPESEITPARFSD